MAFQPLASLWCQNIFCLYFSYAQIMHELQTDKILSNPDGVHFNKASLQYGMKNFQKL